MLGGVRHHAKPCQPGYRMTVPIPTTSSNTTGLRPRPGRELWRISWYLLGLIGSYLATELLIPDTWLWLTLSEEQWHPSTVFFNTGTAGLELAVPLLQILLVTFLVRFLRCLSAGTLQEMRPWLLIRAALLGLSFLLLLSTWDANQAGQRIFDARSAAVLTNLRPGLSQTDVEMLILDADLAMLRPPERDSVEGPDFEGHNLSRNIQDALARINKGERIFEASPGRTRIDAYQRVFDCHQKDKKVQENADHGRVLECYRKYMHVSDQTGGAGLSITFDASNLLQAASYRQWRRSVSCQIIFEVPPAPGKTYPAIC
jgi:hypothetical protein